MSGFSGMIGGQWFDNVAPETKAYLTRNADVLKAYQSNNYGMSADQFAKSHYDKFGAGEKRIWGALPTEPTSNSQDAVTQSPTNGTTTNGTTTSQPLDVGGIVTSVLKGLEPIVSNTSNRPTAPVTQAVDQSHLTSSQLSNILAGNSELNQQAKNKALQIANSRGMANSSMAAGMGTEALISQALPIAQSNSSMYANQDAANQNALNQFSLANLQGEIQSNLAKNNFGYNLGTGIVNNFLQSKRDEAERGFQRETAETNQNYALARMAAEYSQQENARKSQNDFTSAQQAKQNEFSSRQQQLQNDFSSAQLDKQQKYQMDQLKQNLDLAYNKMTLDQTNTYAQGYLNIVNSNMPAEDKAIALSGYSAIYGFHDGATTDTAIDLSALPEAGGG